MIRRIITILLCICLISFTYVFYKPLEDKIVDYFYPPIVIEKKPVNKYARKTNFEFVSISKDFIPYNYQDLLDIFYTVLDSRYDSFTFYCPQEYIDCIKDLEYLTSDYNTTVLTVIGNLVHPYNNFLNIQIQYDNLGEVTLNVNYLYSEEEITKIENEINRIWRENITSTMTKQEIIKFFHDYIVNNTKYDLEFEKKYQNIKGINDDTAKATGVFFNHNSICSGYTDALAIILDRLNIYNFKLASTTHIWNVLRDDGKYYHIDATWDDPVDVEYNENHLQHTFFMIDTKAMANPDYDGHDMDTSIYIELKKELE